MQFYGSLVCYLWGRRREGLLQEVEASPPVPRGIGNIVQDLLFIGLALGLPFGLGTAPRIFRDGDVSWQVAAGEWIIRHGQIPAADPFSYTAFGRPWVAMEWLAEALFGSAFALDGYAGLAAVVAAAVLALFVIVFFHLERRTSRLVMTITLVMIAVVVAPFVLVRPHVLAWPLLAGWTVLLVQAAEEGRPPSLWATLLLVIWTNLHASFPLAVVVEAAIAFDALASSGWSTIRPWLIFGVSSLAALMLNANGFAGLRQPFETTSLSMLPFIAEWHASTTNSTPEFFIVLIIGVGALLYAGARVPIGRLVLLLVLLWMAFLHVRHQSFFIIVAACVLPPLAGSRTSSGRAQRWLIACAAPMLVFRAFVPLLPPEGQGNPRRMIAAIPAELRVLPVLNEYSFGGPLILAGIRPYIDGRAEIYGDDFVANYFKIIDADMPAFNDAVRRYSIQWTMLSHNQTRLIQSMEASGEWRRIYADEFGVIDVREPGRTGIPQPSTVSPPHKFPCCRNTTAN